MEKSEIPRDFSADQLPTREEADRYNGRTVRRRELIDRGTDSDGWPLYAAGPEVK